jgi:hypothetical protein
VTGANGVACRLLAAAQPEQQPLIGRIDQQMNNLEEHGRRARKPRRFKLDEGNAQVGR